MADVSMESLLVMQIGSGSAGYEHFRKPKTMSSPNHTSPNIFVLLNYFQPTNPLIKTSPESKIKTQPNTSFQLNIVPTNTTQLNQLSWI